MANVIQIKQVTMNEKIKIADILNAFDLGLIDKKQAESKLFDLFNVSQQRELLIAYNVDFYKGIHDVSLEDIEHNVDKYLSNL